ncbi:MAG: amidohydrolase family protein [Armatimonadota bacterium]
MVLPIIDARVHISRTIAPWPRAREALRRAGIDTALLTAHPDSPQLSDDLSLPLDVAGANGPWAAYYVGGSPFSGHRRGPLRVPANLGRYRALHIRCFFSPSLDFGGATTSAQWDPDSLEAAAGRADLGELIAAAADLGMPVWLTEHFPVTLALIDRFPRVRWVIPKMGAMNGGTAQVLNALADHDTVFFDSACGELHESIVRRIGPQRILFASGYPFNEPSEALDQVGHLNLPDDQIAAIAGGNLLELLGEADRFGASRGE